MCYVSHLKSPEIPQFVSGVRYNTHMTKNLLQQALFSRQPLKNLEGQVIFQSVTAIELEDGSGHNWNVTGYRNGVEQTIFLKTLD